MEDWILQDLTAALGFDKDDQTWAFCEDHGFRFVEKHDGEPSIDLSSVPGGHLADSNPRRRQVFSRTLVERKRLSRGLPAVINGLSASQAQSQGLTEELSDAGKTSVSDDEALFINDDDISESEQPRSRSRSRSANSPTNQEKLKPFSSNFSVAPLQPGSTFGLPSSSPKSPQTNSSSQPFGSQSTVSSQAKPLASESSKFPKSDISRSTMQAETSHTRQEALSRSNSPKVNLIPPSPSRKSQTVLGEMKASPFAVPAISQTGIFGQPSSSPIPAFPQTGFLGQPASVFGQPSSAIPALPASQPQTDFSTRPNFSFGTSPSFNALAKSDVKDKPGHLGQPPSHSLTWESHSSAQNDKIDSHPSYNSQSQSEKTHGPIPLASTTDISPSSLFKPQKLSPTSSSTLSSNSTSQPQDNTCTTKGEASKPSAISSSLFPASTFFSGTEPPPTAQSSGNQSMPNLQEGYKTFSNSNPTLKDNSLQIHASTNLSTDHPRPVLHPNMSNTSNAIGVGIVKTPDTVSSTSASVKFDHGSQPVRPTAPDPLPAVLDRLTETMMTQEGGLLEQFIENMIKPIIESSLVRFEDEKSWLEAMQARELLLARRYWSRWRTNAWNLGLQRRGKERRKALAKSLQRHARKPSPKRDVLDGFPLLQNPRHGDLPDGPANGAKSMPPPSGASYKRQSLPADVGRQSDQVPQVPRGYKRKRHETDGQMTPKHLPKRSHKRSSTIDTTTMSAPPHQTSRSFHQSSAESSAGALRPFDASLHGESLVTQARRLVPNSRSDTTRTDYFRLKAMGLDPDTPVVPQTRSRLRVGDQPEQARMNTLGQSTSHKLYPTRQIPSSGPDDQFDQSPTRQHAHHRQRKDDGDDEDLFASIRAIKETLADSTSWFKSERETIERSMTPQNSTSPRDVESSAERRLREIRERGPTPSRARIRLQAKGGHAFLPEGYWDAQGLGASNHSLDRGKGREATSPTPIHTGSGSTAMGFAALGPHESFDFVTSELNGHHEEDDAGFCDDQKQGASVEDAIEL